ncbi:MAG: phosphopentomutase, partial [Selenomonadaceae bacterium]|nr:phosphopentomutase [Selenomonadaceae bacterium]
MKKFKRAFIIVLDSYGIGQEPDAADFGDGICNTLKSIAASREYDTPNMRSMGLFNIDGVGCGEPVDAPTASFARLREMSKGKDTTIGHWEIAGIVSERPLPTYPDGFPAEVIEKIENAFGRKV